MQTSTAAKSPVNRYYTWNGAEFYDSGHSAAVYGGYVVCESRWGTNNAAAILGDDVCKGKTEFLIVRRATVITDDG